jgi:hypothetical protein
VELSAQQQELVELAKLVPAEEIPAAKRALESFLDPFSRAMLSTDYDDEPVTPDDIAALEQARLEYARGETIPHEEILREFGLK